MLPVRNKVFWTGFLDLIGSPCQNGEYQEILNRIGESEVERLTLEYLGIPLAEVAENYFDQWAQRGAANTAEQTKGKKGRPITKAFFDFIESQKWDIWRNEINDDLYLGNDRIDDFIEARLIAQASDWMISEGYTHDIPGAQRAFRVYAAQHPRHPVKAYFESLPAWDGFDWIGKLAGYLVSETPFEKVRRFFERFLTGAVNRVYTGEFQPIPVLQCERQGLGKSSLVRFLCPPQLSLYYACSEIKPEDKDHQFNRASVFIWEIGELDATTSKKDVAALKIFLDPSIIRVRKPYGHHDTVKPPLVSFFATVNRAQFLFDDENRRFTVLPIKDIVWAYAQEINLDQLWAQSVYLCAQGAHKWTKEELAEQKEGNLLHTVHDPVDDLIPVYFTFTDSSNDFVSAAELLEFCDASGIKTSRATSMAISRLVLAQGCRKAFRQSKSIRGFEGIRRATQEEMNDRRK
jgi:predicted P-loop ATPase